MNSSLAKPLKTTRSRIANGSTLHVIDVDGRTVEARRFRDVFNEIQADLGGSEHLSEAQRQLARRATLLSIRCELMEADAVLGKAVDFDAYGMMTDRLGRALARLGIRRMAKIINQGPKAQTHEV